MVTKFFKHVASDNATNKEIVVNIDQEDHWFKYEVCVNKFKKEKTFIKQMNYKHKEETIVVCHVCEKEFFTSKSLKDHIERTHGPSVTHNQIGTEESESDISLDEERVAELERLMNLEED